MSLSENMEILIVDDSSFMRKIFKNNLVQLGFVNVDEAADGDEALQKLQASEYRLVICDWNMPKRTGLEVLQWMRMDSEFEGVPFIMATAQGDKQRVTEALDAGANAHITKPFDAEQLKEKIEIAFGLRQDVHQRSRKLEVIDGKLRIKMAHIQITDHLLLGVIKEWIDQGQFTPKYFELETFSMPGWNPVQESLEKGEVDGAFVLAPIAMDLYAHEVPLKLVSLAHKNGSIFVRSKHRELVEDGAVEDIFFEHSVQIPHKMSIHHLLAHRMLRDEYGLSPGVPGMGEEINVTFEVVPPVQMPKALAEDANVAGFIVAEPIGSKAISSGVAELQCLSSELWKDHPCCVVVFQEDVIGRYPDAVQEFTLLLAKAGRWVEENKGEAAKLAVRFLDPSGNLGLKSEILEKVLTMAGGITMHDLYPVVKDLDEMQRYMHYEMGIGKLIDVDHFVDLDFADEVRRLLS